MKIGLEFLRHLWKADAFSPTAFLVRAIIITMLFGVSELLGLSEYTTFLSGTSANLNVSWQTAATFGLIHLLLYMGFILLVPIFLITASLLAGWIRWKGKRDHPEQTPQHSSELVEPQRALMKSFSESRNRP